MKSKTKISKQLERKTNPFLVETIRAIKKHKPWIGIAGILSGPRRNFVNLNLREINEKSKDSETVIIPGKVLSLGELDKKIRIVAFNFSGRAKAKLSKSKSEAINIIDEIKKNPEAKGVRVLEK